MIIQDLKELQTKMREVSKKMKSIKDKEVQKKADELIGASNIIDSWIEGIKEGRKDV